jgi:hypothetical protein
MASFVGVPGGLGAPMHGFVSGAALPFYDALSHAHNDTGGNATADDTTTYLSARFATWYIPACALAGVLFALYQVAHVSAVRVHSTTLDDDDTEALLGPAGEHDGARRCCISRSGRCAATAPAASRSCLAPWEARRRAQRRCRKRALGAHARIASQNVRAGACDASTAADARAPRCPCFPAQTSCVHARRCLRACSADAWR